MQRKEWQLKPTVTVLISMLLILGSMSSSAMKLPPESEVTNLKDISSRYATLVQFGEHCLMELKAHNNQGRHCTLFDEHYSMEKSTILLGNAYRALKKDNDLQSVQKILGYDKRLQEIKIDISRLREPVERKNI